MVTLVKRPRKDDDSENSEVFFFLLSRSIFCSICRDENFWVPIVAWVLIDSHHQYPVSRMNSQNSKLGSCWRTGCAPHFSTFSKKNTSYPIFLPIAPKYSIFLPFSKVGSIIRHPFLGYFLSVQGLGNFFLILF